MHQEAEHTFPLFSHTPRFFGSFFSSKGVDLKGEKGTGEGENKHIL